MFYLLTANKCGLNHKKTWFKPKKPMIFYNPAACLYLRRNLSSLNPFINESRSNFRLRLPNISNPEEKLPIEI
jgi:hypothetical protein